MAIRAVEQVFTGATNQWDAPYDPTKTTMGDLIKQYTGTTAREKYAGPVRFGRDAAMTTYYGLARPMEAETNVAGMYPHAVSWASKGGYYATGTVSVTTTSVTGTNTLWLTNGVPIGAQIGFGSNDPAAITTWYQITAIPTDTAITIQNSVGSPLAGVPYVINKSYERDWVFLADNAAVNTTRRITMYEFDRLTSVFLGAVLSLLTYPTATNHTIRGMKAVYAVYNTGTVTVATTPADTYISGTVTVAATAVTGSATNTVWTSAMIGMSIGFYTNTPSAVSQWYVISAASNASGTGSITLATTAGVVAAGTSYVITTTTVTGSVGMTWNTDRIMIGSRIGFGSNDPTQISRWYYVSALTAASVVSSETSFYIQATATANGCGGVTANITFPAGTPYVIEDLRILTSTTNATTTNGGLYMTPGLAYDDFANSLTIPAATTVDKAKAVFWLTDTTNAANGGEIPSGCALDDRDSWAQQYCYCIEYQGASTPQVFKYNIRAALSGLSSGRSMTALVLATAMQTVTGTVSQTNNGVVCTLNHGPGKGVKSLYFVTTTRIYRAPISAITQGAQVWAADSMVEIPPGGLQTYLASATLTHVECSEQLDRLIVMTNGSQGVTLFNRHYITQYNNISIPIDLAFGIETRQLDQSAASNDICPTPCLQGTIMTTWCQGGMVYMARSGAAGSGITINQVYAIPLGADWDFAGGAVSQRLITPALSTADAVTLRRVVVNSEDYMGANGLRLPMESYRVYFRTAGISDNSGAWVLVDNTGDLSAAAAGAQVQFMLEFKTIGTFCLPARVYSIACLYNDATTDTHFQPSVAQSSTTNKYFTWRFSTAFGASYSNTVPTLRIRLYDAVTGGLLLDDNTLTSTMGAWTKDTGAGTYGAGSYNSTDKTNETTYIRYTPTSIGDNIKVRALLTLA